MGKIIIDETGIQLEGDVTQEFVRVAIGGLSNYFEQTMKQVFLSRAEGEGEMVEVPPMLSPDEVAKLGLEIPEDEDEETEK
jgi:hypothetical protein